MATAVVPATTANLGPGFDVLGLALNLYNTFTVEEIERGLTVRVTPDSDIPIPRDERNLVFRAAKRLFDEVGYRIGGLAITIENGVPLGRGLGSSSTAIVGGLAAANAIASAALSKEELFALATEIEGHPDNVGPAIYGGFTICYPCDGSFKAVSLAPAANLRPVALIPNSTLETKRARGVLPVDVPMSDAVFNISRTGLLVSVLLSGRSQFLRDAMQDKLHQPYRAPLIPGLTDIIEEATAMPGVGIALSGAGPSLICIVDREHEARFLERIQGVLKSKKGNYAAHLAEFDLDGVRVRVV